MTPLAFPLNERGTALSSALGKARGLRLSSGHRGTLRSRSIEAEVVLEPDGCLRVAMPLKCAPPPRAALVAHRSLPGNARFAGSPLRRQLLADTCVDGIAHLKDSLSEIRRSFASARARRAPARTRKREALRSETVAAALEALAWEEGAVVPRPDGWELRPRLAGRVHPLRLTIEDGALRLRRTLLDALPEDLVGAAIAEQALRLNARFKYTRFALDGAALCLESRLRGELVKPSWIALCARSIAAAAQHARPLVRVLSKHEDVARCCVHSFSHLDSLGGHER